jgi:hypothetical protein
VPGVVSVVADTGAALPRWRLVPDDEALRRLDVPRTLVFDTVAAAGGSCSYRASTGRSDRAGCPDGGASPMAPAHRRVVEEAADDRRGGRIVDGARLGSRRPTPSMIRGRTASAGSASTCAPRRFGGTARGIEAAPGVEPTAPRSRSPARSRRRARQRRLLVAPAAALALVVVLYLAPGCAREVTVVPATLPVAFAGGLYALGGGRSGTPRRSSA